MRKFLWVISSIFLFAPAAALADFTLAASAGKAFRVAPTSGGEPTTLMVAPGVTFADEVLRFEVGFVASLSDLAPAGTRPDVQVRPALVIGPPVIPLYGRVFGVADRIIHGVRLIPGAALGLNFDLGTVGIFAEAGALPRITDANIEWLLEPRAGVLFTF
jgi:hypothetical protein